MPKCATCGPPECAECDPIYGEYSVVGQTYLNDYSGLTSPCPEGFICGPGGGPWNPPPPPPPDPTCPNPPCPGGGGGGGKTIELQGCESLIVRSVPAGISQEAYNAVLTEMLQERANQQERCDEWPGIPNPGATRNSEQCIACPDDSPMTQLGNLPQGVYIKDDQLCLAAGVFTATSKVFNGVTYNTFKEAVDARALAFITNALTDGLTEGIISCGLTCGSGSAVQIQGFTTGMLGTFSPYTMVLSGTGGASGAMAVNAFVPDANPGLSYWILTNFGVTSGYAFTTALKWAQATVGINAGKYYPNEFCTGTGLSAPPTFLYNGLGVPFVDIYNPSAPGPYGGSGLPAWDGQFTLEDTTGSGFCASHREPCEESFGSLAGWGIDLSFFEGFGFFLDIYGYSIEPTGILSAEILWQGLYATVDDQDPIGVYLTQNIGSALINPPSITLEAVPPPP